MVLISNRGHVSSPTVSCLTPLTFRFLCYHFCFFVALSSVLASSLFQSSIFRKCYKAAQLIKPVRRISSLKEGLVPPIFVGFHLIKPCPPRVTYAFGLLKTNSFGVLKSIFLPSCHIPLFRNMSQFLSTLKGTRLGRAWPPGAGTVGTTQGSVCHVL